MTLTGYATSGNVYVIREAFARVRNLCFQARDYFPTQNEAEQLGHTSYLCNESQRDILEYTGALPSEVWA